MPNTVINFPFFSSLQSGNELTLHACICMFRPLLALLQWSTVEDILQISTCQGLDLKHLIHPSAISGHTVPIQDWITVENMHA